MGSPAPDATDLRRAAVWRGAVLFVLWLALTLGRPSDLLAGAVAAAVATWASLRLLPTGASRLSPSALAAFTLRFFGQSVLAGIDVARRALDPRLQLRLGFVAYPTRLSHGTMRNTFCTVASLLPGTLPAASDEGGALIIHCLDVDQPVAGNLAVDEKLLMRALGARRDHE